MSEQSVNLLPLVHRQDILTPEALLEQVLPLITASIPDATCAQVYRLARGGMVVWHNTSEGAAPGNYYPLEAGSPYEVTAETGEAALDEQHNVLIAPLRGQHGTIFGLLTVEFNQPPTAKNTLDMIAPQLGSALYSKQLEQLLHRQVALTSEFNQAQTIEQIASIFAKNVVQPSQFAVINAFQYNSDSTLTGALSLVSANRNRTFGSNEAINVNLSYLQIIHEALSSQGDFLISDVASDDSLPSADKEWLLARKARSGYFLPLRIQNDLYGFITIIDTANALAPTPLEKQIFQNVAEQAATIIEKRRLLEQAESSLRESQLLYDLVGDLMQTSNPPEILEVLYQYVGQGTRNVTLSEVYYDANGQIADIVIRHIIRDDVAHEIAVSWGEHYEPHELETFTRFMQKIGDELHILENYDDYKDEVTIISRLQAQGINSSLAIPIYRNKYRTLLFTLAWGEPRHFDNRLMQLMQTAKAQIALVLKNQELISSAQSAAQESQTQATQLQQIAEFSQAMQASLQVEDILKAALQYGQLIVAGDYIAVMSYDRTVDSFRMSAQFWGDESRVTLPGIVLSKESDSIAQQAWETRQLIHIDKLQADWEWQHPLIATLRSMMVAPLMAGGVLLGILEIGSLQDSAFSPIDVAAFRQMTNQLAVAYANAETYSQSQRLARNKVQANEIIAHMQQQADVNAILHVTAQELGKALGAKRARIRLGLDVPGPSGD
jgi:GAF domain-containing protein